MYWECGFLLRGGGGVNSDAWCWARSLGVLVFFLHNISSALGSVMHHMCLN